MSKPTVFSAIPIIALLAAATPSQARWMNPKTGRFHTMDTYDGDKRDPASLHKYVYCANNPVNVVDPSGHEGEYISLLSAMTIGTVLFAEASPANAAAAATARRVVTGRVSSRGFWAAYPDYNIMNNNMVWDLLGGSLGAEYGPRSENSCATRVSYGFNNMGGADIPEGTPYAYQNRKAVSYKNRPGDNKFYIISAGRMKEYLTTKWGRPDSRPNTVAKLNNFVSALAPGQIALFATWGEHGHGHSGVLKQGYQDPHVTGFLPVDVWALSAQ